MPPKRQPIPAADQDENLEESATQPDIERQPSIPPAPPSTIRQQSIISDTPTPNLAEAISLMTEELRKRDKRPAVKVKEPDTFDGSDPRKLNNFILLCNLYFRQNSAYSDDSAKVNFALSHLRGLALDLFEPTLLDSEDIPEWLEDWPTFLQSLRLYFGPIDPTGDAEDSIDNLKMRENQRIVKYDVEFNRLAIRTGWNNTVLRHRYYSGLAERIKDIMGQQAKPTTLEDTKKLAHAIDARYWERLREKSHSDKSHSKSDNRSDNKSDKKSNNNSQSSSSQNNSNNKSSSKSHSHSNSNSHSHSHNNKSGKSSNSTSASSDKPAYSDKLKDGKLTSQERQRRLDNDLCLYCGETGHKADACTKKGSSSTKAKGRAAKTEEKETATTPPKKE
jgi:Domain of unknown function (DUF4939)